MASQAPRISVIIAAYRSGDGLQRVVESLDRQTMPQSEFETIIIDDGSPDDTYARMQALASARTNMRIGTIENSGWPSRPRNVAIDMARGEYVMFMDHDDSIFPEGLQRACDYAEATGADLLSPKESKTNDSWWGLSSLTDGNVPDVRAEGGGGIERLLPMVPHKLYRRSLMNEHGLRFPEGSRVLWEDIFINIGVYRHAKVVAVQADSPFYLWHASDTNSSHTFNPRRVDFWDRLSDVLEFIDTTLSGADWAADRTAAMAHQVRSRVLDRTFRAIARERSWLTARMVLRRARRLYRRYADDAVLERLDRRHRIAGDLLLRGDLDLIRAMHAADQGFDAVLTAGRATWADGALQLDLDCWWQSSKPELARLRRAGNRVVWDLGHDLNRAISPEHLDVTDEAGRLLMETNLRSRFGSVSWQPPVEHAQQTFTTGPRGTLALHATGRAVVDPATAACGARLEDNVWDVRARVHWLGSQRTGALKYAGPHRPAVTGGRVVIAYANSGRGLSIDTGQRLRTLFLDGDPRNQDTGPIHGFSTRLTTVDVFGELSVEAMMLAAVAESRIPEGISALPAKERAAALAGPAAEGRITGRLTADGSGVVFEGSADLEPGRYAILTLSRGAWHVSARRLVVGADGMTSIL